MTVHFRAHTLVVVVFPPRPPREGMQQLETCESSHAEVPKRQGVQGNRPQGHIPARSGARWTQKQ